MLSGSDSKLENVWLVHHIADSDRARVSYVRMLSSFMFGFCFPCFSSAILEQIWSSPAHTWQKSRNVRTIIIFTEEASQKDFLTTKNVINPQVHDILMKGLKYI